MADKKDNIPKNAEDLSTDDLLKLRHQVVKDMQPGLYDDLGGKDPITHKP